MGTGHFFLRYFLGFGTTVELGKVGLARNFEQAPSVRSAVDRYKSCVAAIAEDGFIENNHRDATDVTNEAHLFSVGRSTLFESAKCGASSCTLSFPIRDWFADPINRGIELGITYRINNYWSERVYYQW